MKAFAKFLFAKRPVLLEHNTQGKNSIRRIYLSGGEAMTSALLTPGDEAFNLTN